MARDQARSAITQVALPLALLEDSLSTATIVGSSHIELADALDRYTAWPAPTVIMSDGAYGVAGFPGDPPTAAGLVDWYRPHVAAWSRHALPETSLWFWGTEVGWASVHPLLAEHGWIYRTAHVWDKGIAHIAGNVNSKTIRKFPVVTELCVHYDRDVRLPTHDGHHLALRDWLRHEWFRTGLPLYKTNEACQVKNAATRKYFTHDHLWYFPPPEMIERLATYANQHGKSTNWTYFSIDGTSPITPEEWARLRSKWNHTHGLTNVWTHPAIRGDERLKDARSKILHTNQKPLKLIERIIHATSDPGDVIWEPFGGLCTAAVASLYLDRRCYSAECIEDFYRLAVMRLMREGTRHARGEDTLEWK